MYRRIGYVSLAYLLLLSLACGTSGEGTSTEDETPSSIQIRRATYGTALNPQQQIVNPVTEFTPGDPVCISLEIAGRPRSGTITLRWPFGAENVEANLDLSDVNGTVLFSIGETTYVGGTLTHDGPLPAGPHETIVLYNGTEVARYPFQVTAPPASITGPFVIQPTAGNPPAPVMPVPSATPVIYAIWSHPNVPAGEHITLSLVAVNVGAAADPMTTITTAEVDVAEAGPQRGPLNFSLPRAWPPGSYRVVGTGSTLGEFATLDFTIQ